MKEWSILTPINEAVVVLLVCFASVAFSCEGDIGDSLRATISIVVESGVLKRSDGGVEQFLVRTASKHREPKESSKDANKP
jgi:hypothetical protein